MSALEKMRKMFDECTVMAGVEPDFECIYITKDAANALFDEAEAENAKLQKQGARLFDKTLELAGENHKLREQMAEWKRVAESKQDIIDHMRDANAENAKLRKLVDELWALAYGYVPYEGELDDARDMMRELGIEVSA
jgi:hypothetical protein